MNKLIKRLGVLFMAAFMVPMVFSFKTHAKEIYNQGKFEPGQRLAGTIPYDSYHNYSFSLSNTSNFKITATAKHSYHLYFKIYTKSGILLSDEHGSDWNYNQLKDNYSCTLSLNLKKGDYVLSLYNNDSGAYSYNIKTSTSDINEISSVKIKLTKGKTLDLSKLLYTKGTITWSTGNKKIATVTSKGVVKGVKKGNTTITAYSKSSKEKIILKLYVV